MGMDKLSRRQMVGVVGAAAALASSGVALAAPPKGATLNEPQSPEPDSAPLAALIAPLTAGSQIGAWRVVGIVGVRAGAVTVGLQDHLAHRFYLDVCRRDDAGPEPPARTALCDVFVANEGDGSVATVEDHGLAAMALAEVVRANEHRCDLSGMMTQRARLTAFGDQVVRGLD